MKILGTSGHGILFLSIKNDISSFSCEITKREAGKTTDERGQTTRGRNSYQDMDGRGIHSSRMKRRPCMYASHKELGEPVPRKATGHRGSGCNETQKKLLGFPLCVLSECAATHVSYAQRRLYCVGCPNFVRLCQVAVGSLCSGAAASLPTPTRASLPTPDYVARRQRLAQPALPCPPANGKRQHCRAFHSPCRCPPGPAPAVLASGVVKVTCPRRPRPSGGAASCGCTSYTCSVDDQMQASRVFMNITRVRYLRSWHTVLLSGTSAYPGFGSRPRPTAFLGHT